MKRFLALTVLTLFSVTVFSQNLTLTELINLNKKTKWQQVDVYLKKKGWRFNETSATSNGKNVSWCYKKQSDSHRALAWFTLTLTNDVPSKISYEFSSDNAFTNIKKATLILKLKESATTVGQDITTTSYSNPNTWVVLNKLTGKLADKLIGAPSISYTVELYPMFGDFDKINGSKTEKYPSGLLKKEYTLRNGMLDGVVKEYHANGKLSATTTFSMGKKQGLTTTYDEAGLPLTEIFYSNDAANGDIKEYDMGKVKVTGTMVNGKKDGVFVSYDLQGNIVAKYSMKGDSLSGRYIKNIYTTNGSVKTVTGDYDNGLKSGYWETAVISNGTKEVLEYATYRLGVKDGNFKEMEGDSLVVGSYRAGKLDGKLESYYFGANVDKDFIPSIDKAKRTSVFYYSNGLLNGPFEMRDDNGMVIAKGTMVNGRRDGEWTLTAYEPDDKGKPTLLIHKGTFARDAKVGEWIASTVDNITVRRYSHKNGIIDGKIVEYSWKGVALREKTIDNEKMVKLSLYDSLGKNIERTIDILRDEAGYVHCKMTTFKPSSTTFCGYFLKKNNEKPCNPATFETEFKQHALNSKNATNGGAEGEYKELTPTNEVLVEGRYEKNEKVGKWKRYYYNMDIIVTTDYNTPKPLDNYLDLPTGKPYTGRFVEAYSNGQIKCDLKVYLGLLDGKAKYYDQDGKMTKMETYSQGVLKSSKEQ